MKKSALSLVVGCVVVLGAGAAWWLPASAKRDRIADALPPVPDLSSVLPEARQAIRAADERALGVLTARKGLAELSRVYHANGFLEPATRCYELLEQIDPREPRWFHRHATILAGFGEVEPAIALWRKVLELDSGFELARLRLGDALLKRNRRQEAAAVYADILQRNPQNPHAQLGLARIDFEARRWDAARQRLEALVAQTNYELGYDLIVSLYERTGDAARAAAVRGAKKASGAYRDPTDPWMDELLEVCFDPYRLSVAAGTMAKEAAPRSIQLLHRAIALAPQDVSNHYQLGMLQMQEGNTDAARQELELCTKIAPDFSDGWAQLSGLLVRLGDKPAADRVLEQGLEKCPKSPGLHLMYARNLRDSGQIAAAVREFQISSELRPNEPDAYLELGNMLIRLGRRREGVEQIQEALRVAPGEPTATSILAFNAIVQGDEAEARRWLERVHAQPRIEPRQVQALWAAFEKQFGHAP